MNNIKKLSIISFIWNILLLLLLFFQSSFIYSIIKNNLIPTLEFIKPVIDEQFINFITNRIIIICITVIIMILFEIILFFIVNHIIYKQYRVYKNNDISNKLTNKINNLDKYYKFMNIYMAISVISFISILVYNLISLYYTYIQVDLTIHNQTLNTIYEMTVNTSFNTLSDIQLYIIKIITEIKHNSEIYNFVLKTLNFSDCIYYTNYIFYIISYLLIFIGLILNVNLYINLDRE